MNLFKIISLLLLACFSYSYADIYKWVDKTGTTHYSEIKPENIAVEEFVIKSYKNVTFEDVQKSDNVTPHKYKPIVRNVRARKVVMYSAPWCGYCKKAKAYFKSKNISYTDYDIEKSSVAKLRYKKLGAKGIPVIFVGNKRMNGFSVSGFNRLYTSS